MGHQIIKQPDGRLAVFSSVVDAWVLVDASPQDVEDDFIESAVAEARRQIRRYLDAVIADEPRLVYHQWTMSFEEADALSAEHGHRLADLQAGIGLAQT